MSASNGYRYLIIQQPFRCLLPDLMAYAFPLRMELNGHLLLPEKYSGFGWFPSPMLAGVISTVHTSPTLRDVSCTAAERGTWEGSPGACIFPDSVAASPVSRTGQLRLINHLPKQVTRDNRTRKVVLLHARSFNGRVIDKLYIPIWRDLYHSTVENVLSY